MKYLLRAQKNNYFVKSDQENPTLYVSSLPQYAEEFKSQGKGIAFIGSNFMVGLFGDAAGINMDELEKVAKELSSKPVKVMKKDNVSFKFKEKGKKPINVKGVC